MKVVRVLILIAFFNWLLPLGGLVKISRQAEVCGGQRAICLCEAGRKAIQKPVSGPPQLSRSEPAGKEGAAGSASKDYLLPERSAPSSDHSISISFSAENPTEFILDRRIKQVPKA